MKVVHRFGTQKRPPHIALHRMKRSNVPSYAASGIGWPATATAVARASRVAGLFPMMVGLGLAGARREAVAR